MAEYGLNVFDDHGIKTLGMEDFTIKRLASQIVPAISSAGAGFKTAYDLIMDVPGYDPANCFVIITPRQYAGYDQTISDLWPVLPTYVDLGGTRIGLRTWLNYGVYDGHRFKYSWLARTVECVVEVVRVA